MHVKDIDTRVINSRQSKDTSMYLKNIQKLGLIFFFLSTCNGQKNNLLSLGTKEIDLIDKGLLLNNLSDISINEFNDICMFNAAQNFIEVCLLDGFEQITHEIKMKTTINICLCEFAQVYTLNDRSSGISEVLEYCSPTALANDSGLMQCVHQFKMFPQTWMTYTTVFNKLPSICTDYSKPFERLQMMSFLNNLKSEMQDSLKAENIDTRNKMFEELAQQKKFIFDKIDDLAKELHDKNTQYWNKFHAKNKVFEKKLIVNQKILKTSLDAHNKMIEKDVLQLKSNFQKKVALLEVKLLNLTTLTSKNNEYINTVKHWATFLHIAWNYTNQYYYYAPLGLLFFWWFQKTLLVSIIISTISYSRFQIPIDMIILINLLVYSLSFISKIRQYCKISTIFNVLSLSYGLLLVQETYSYTLGYYCFYFILYQKYNLATNTKMSFLVSLLLFISITIVLSLLFYKVI